MSDETRVTYLEGQLELLNSKMNAFWDRADQNRFIISIEQRINIDHWLASLPEDGYKPIKYIFSRSSGIGLSLVVKKGKHKKDFTEYEKW